MKSTDLLMVIAIVAVAFASVNLIITIDKIKDFKALTGFAIDTGTANLTISGLAQINFTTDVISWGTGSVPTGKISCELDTENNENCTDFTAVNGGLILENIGNVNVTLNLSSDKNAASFIGGSDATPMFQWKVTNNETGSCLPDTNITSYTDVTVATQLACENFGYLLAADALEIDLRVVIPSDAAGTKGSIITATATSIA